MKFYNSNKKKRLSFFKPMKFLYFLSFLLLISPILSQTLPLCLLEQGCIANYTDIIGYLPISPKTNYRQSIFILFFADKIVLSFGEQSIKSFSFGEINLDCGPENNKLCLLQDYQGKALIKKTEFLDKRLCFVLNSIFAAQPTFLCERDEKKQGEFLEKINILSRLIDNYQFKMLNTVENPLNNFPRSHFSVFYNENQRLVLLKVNLYLNKIQGVLGEKTIFQWDFKEINPFKSPIPVKNVLKTRSLSRQLVPLQKSLNNSKNIKIEDCMVVYVKNEVKFLCSKVKLVLETIQKGISSNVNRLKYLRDFELLSTILKIHNNSMSFSPSMKELSFMRSRLIRLETYNTLFCLKNRGKIQENTCLKAKNRDINDETYFLSQNSENIYLGLKKPNRFMNKGQKNKGVIGFLQIDSPTEDNLKKSEVYKRKIMGKLQKNRIWTISEDERAKGDFMKKSDSDPFVTYLGYIRDSMLGGFKAQQQKTLKNK